MKKLITERAEELGEKIGNVNDYLDAMQVHRPEEYNALLQKVINERITRIANDIAPRIENELEATTVRANAMDRVVDSIIEGEVTAVEPEEDIL